MHGGTSFAMWCVYIEENWFYVGLFKPLFNATRKMKNLLKELIFYFSLWFLHFFRSPMAQLSFTCLFARSVCEFLVSLFIGFSKRIRPDYYRSRFSSFIHLLPICTTFIFIHFQRRWHITIIFSFLSFVGISFFTGRFSHTEQIQHGMDFRFGKAHNINMIASNEIWNEKFSQFHFISPFIRHWNYCFVKLNRLRRREREQGAGDR